MKILSNLLTSVAIIGGADGPTSVTVSGELPLPAITLIAIVILLLIYTYASKAIRSKKAPAIKAASAAPAIEKTSIPAAATAPSGVELIGVDEETAAVIMAIVSDKSGIPLNRLAFKSIKLMEDK